MPYPTNPALEAAVVADCENDLPRLVYADWLDENGDPARAAFTRAQIALHDKSPADPDYQDVVELHREAWDRVIRRNFVPPGLPFHLAFDSGLFDSGDDLEDGMLRGFPFWVNAQTGDEEHAGDPQVAVGSMPHLLPLFRQHSTIRGVRYDSEHVEQLADDERAFGPDMEHAFAGDEWAGLHAFHADGDIDLSVARQVARSPMAASLRWLRLSVWNTADAEALAAARFPHLRRWEVLGGFTSMPAAIQKVLSAPWFARLRHVHFNLFGPPAKRIWAALAVLPDLHTLSIYPHIGGLARLAGAKGFAALGRLHLHAVAPDAADLAALVRAKFPRLAVFETTNCELRNDGLAELLAADWWAGLRALKLHHCLALTDRAIAAVGNSSAAAGLRSLTVATPKLGRLALASLATSYPALTTLNLDTAGTPKATAEQVTAFGAALALPRLRRLNLSGWPVGDTGAVALAKNASLANLTRLDLFGTGLGVKGVRAVLESPHLQRVGSLNLGRCDGGKATAALADPSVLPGLAYCRLPERVDKKTSEKLRRKRPEVFFV